jgi:hypothetical protein
MENDDQHDIVLRGARAMCEALPELGIQPPAFAHHLKKGRVKCVTRLGALYIASRKALRAEFGLKP